KASVSGLNLSIPSGFAGVDVPVTVTYATTGVGGAVTSGTSSTLTLDEIKYTVGNTVKTTPTASVAANTMKVVASYPTLALGQSDGHLATGQVKLATFTITANANGQIKLENLPLTVSTSGNVTASSQANNILVTDAASGATITTTNTALSVGTGSSGNVTVAFTNGYTIPAGTSKTFNIFLKTAANVTGNAGVNTITTQLGSSSSFTWDDVVGNGSSLTGASIFNYPTATSTITN
ncbi:MAG TPA: hypothetical protein VFK07_02755, partial [Candidatus Paceibacterota bacterium]|nr:hypothetical protein [Candidatus Paceibacterota bacterium]